MEANHSGKGASAATIDANSFPLGISNAYSAAAVVDEAVDDDDDDVEDDVCTALATAAKVEGRVETPKEAA
jgi:hypothetical protein